MLCLSISLVREHAWFGIYISYALQFTFYISYSKAKSNINYIDFPWICIIFVCLFAYFSYYYHMKSVIQTFVFINCEIWWTFARLSISCQSLPWLQDFIMNLVNCVFEWQFTFYISYSKAKSNVNYIDFSWIWIIFVCLFAYFSCNCNIIILAYFISFL